MTTSHTGDATKDERTGRIRGLNDTLRTARDPIGALIINGSLVVTAAVAEKGNPFLDRAIDAVRRFSAFTPDNDPYGEHDMAFLEVDGETIFFKVDYYDRTLEWHSPDPADAAVTRRVLTIGLAADY